MAWQVMTGGEEEVVVEQEQEKEREKEEGCLSCLMFTQRASRTGVWSTPSPRTTSMRFMLHDGESSGTTTAQEQEAEESQT